MKVKCERLNDQGSGVCYYGGKVVFVPELLPGEEANIMLIKEKKNYMEGKVVEYLSYSKDRINPLCPYLNCGCQVKSLSYDKQLIYKQEKVKNILKKFSGLTGVVSDIIKCDNINFYRNKITLKVNKKVGYYKNKTNNFLPINSCAIASEKANEIIKVLNILDLSKVNEIVIKTFNETMIIIDGTLDYTKLKKYADSIYMNNHLVYGMEYIETKLFDLTFKISKNSFFQVNTSMIETLYKTAIDLVKNENTVLDLFCGTGTISLILSKYFKKVIGIELNEEAVKCANINKKINNINNVEFICGDANKVCKNLKADVVFVDPPRSGLSKDGINNILNINPNSIVYISCDPITLSRDLNVLKEKYNVVKVIPVDLFPNTYHIENIAFLKK